MHPCRPATRAAEALATKLQNYIAMPYRAFDKAIIVDIAADIEHLTAEIARASAEFDDNSYLLRTERGKLRELFLHVTAVASKQSDALRRELYDIAMQLEKIYKAKHPHQHLVLQSLDWL